MRRHSPENYSPPRRGYGGRGRSPPRRKYGGGRRESGQSLLVRNIPMNCRPEDLRIPFERYGRVRDVYMPKDYYSGEPRGFAFVEFVDPHDAVEAQYHMNRQRFGGREITVVVAAETRKRPEDMRHRTRLGGPSSRYESRRSSGYGRSHSRSRSRSRSPYHQPNPRTRPASRSYSPAPRREGDYSASPRRHSERGRSPRGRPEGRGEDYKPRSPSPPGYRRDLEDRRANGHRQKDLYDDERGLSGSRSPRHVSGSPPGSRSRSADVSPERGR